jgi:hypothetical protein
MKADGDECQHAVRICEHPLDSLSVQVSEWMDVPDLKVYLEGFVSGLSLGVRAATDCQFCRADLVDVGEIVGMLSEDAYQMRTGKG